ncbi:MAG: DUF4177 domain-containing protein [Clostridium sp.]|jgi:uncharacterized protein YbgA (DUF1722 family)|uniref:DUF4177 domain-containing protein n=1 Tax=Clostridium coskatii TaxID=1705578 RepID=A0A166T5V3_9CLOT|nr:MULTISPECIES: DUF4177 domain-containing protein [Clostridium]MCH3964606.1 DUF4177 domain-containing protein [Clostridium sp.]MCH4198567.1 DUF4177 domain-containing protein [Clostridium tyrobutyricum]MCH4238004.1 DUF4177 domain-containing protein [Clostridium tyrobutyricum]MCH4258898.1 DUF4177 domain-containing protein [Clostridium tyrobutyricum]MCI1239754.1 DUF4177 domain-containing protein [Clostridium tyrobutyricum]
MEWKYKVFTVDHFLSSEENLSIEELLNKYGKDRWELVGILQNSYKTLGKISKLESDLIVFKKSEYKS